VLGPVSHHMAQATIDDRVRTARAYRRGQGRLAGMDPQAHAEQRELVQASLLAVRRIDRSAAS
jgi:hypothetical protein